MKMLDALLDRDNEVFSSTYEKRKEKPDPKGAAKKAMNADVYITSTNAITKQVELVNIDMQANRVGVMIYGPQKVIVVAGKNKITQNHLSAIARIKKEVCPPNTRRLKFDTPCARTGKCTECDSKQRICNVIVRIQYPPTGKEFHIIMVDENLGY